MTYEITIMFSKIAMGVFNGYASCFIFNRYIKRGSHKKNLKSKGQSDCTFFLNEYN